jgi:hypothetical protein
MDYCDIILTTNNKVIKKYEKVNLIYLEKFSYITMIINRDNIDIINIEWNNSEIMEYIFDVCIEKSEIKKCSYIDLIDALNYLCCNISFLNFYKPDIHEFDIINECKTDNEFNYFAIYFFCKNLKLVNMYFDKQILEKDYLNYYDELINGKKYYELESFLINHYSKINDDKGYSTFFDKFDDKEYPTFFENIDISFSKRFPAIWWFHLIVTKQCTELEIYSDVINEYCPKLLISCIGDYNVDVILNKYNIRIEQLDLKKVVAILFNSNDLHIIKKANACINSFDYTVETFMKYKNKFVDRFNFWLNNIIELNCSFLFLNLLGVTPEIYSITLHNYLHFNDLCYLDGNERCIFKLSKDFFRIFSSNKYVISFNKVGLDDIIVFLKYDNKYGTINDFCENKIILLQQPNYKLGQELNIEYLNNANIVIKNLNVKDNCIVLRPHGYVKILDNCIRNCYLKCNNFHLFYFQNKNEEKIVVHYKNKFKIYNSQNMFLHILHMNFWKFIRYHVDIEL